MTNVIFCHFLGAGDPSLLGHHDDTNSNDDERPTVYTSKNVNNFSNFSKGWLAIAKLKPLSLFIFYFNIVKCFLKH